MKQLNQKLNIRINKSIQFYCYLSMQQVESLSPFLFSMYLNDTENEFHFQGINIYQIKWFVPLYTYDITIFLFRNS